MDKLLVSVIITSYNSSLFILETLESAKAQTYPNIELIISDDCSIDNTVALCSVWLSENKHRFIRTELITVPHNTGVSANCNRSINASRAEWIKFIAGDDILLPTCIEDNMNFVSQHKEVHILFSQVLLYDSTFHKDQYIRTIPATLPVNIMNPAFTAKDQFKLLLLSDRISFTPSYFFHKQAVLSVGGYDEHNRLMEDYPMWLKLTKAGYRLYFMEKATVGYRQHQNATNNRADDSIFKPLILKMYAFRKKNVHPYLPWDMVGAENHTIFVAEVFQRLGLNKNRLFQRVMYRFFSVYVNPFQYVVSFKKHILGWKKKSVFYAN